MQGACWNGREEPQVCRVITIGHVKPEPVRLDGFDLLKDLYKKAARDGGMKGKLEWRTLTSDDAKMNEQLDVDVSYWGTGRDSLHASLLVVEK